MNIKNNIKLKKISAVLLGCSVIICSISATVLAVADNGKSEPENVVQTAEVSNDTDTENGLVKDETVYVLASADGGVQKIIVSNWIKNSLGNKTVTDKSNLDDIQNVKGDETYTINGDNMKVWDADGNDIYYQGNISKELPVDLSVSYKLNGKNVSIEEIAGKSGKVTIRFDYKNNQCETVKIDGKEEKIYVPFAMITGMILDNAKFKNVQVSNGKLLNDGDRTFVAGISFPSLQSNLNLDDGEFEIPDYIEITADVDNFEIGNTITIATNEIFNKINTENLTSLDDLTASCNDLVGGMNSLLDGSSQLYGGLCTLLDKSDQLITGINKLAEGAAELKNGINELYVGTKELSDGLSQLTDNNDTLNSGSKQVFETLLKTANSQLAAAGLTVPTLTVENYSATLDSVINSLNADAVKQQAEDTARQTVTAQVNSQKDVITAAVTENVRSNVLTQILQAYGISEEQYLSGVMTDQIDAAVEATMQSENIVNTINTETQKQISNLIEQNMLSDTVQSQINAAVETAKAGVKSIKDLKEQLDSYNAFYSGLLTYTTGVSSAKDGADELTDGTQKLSNGFDSLFEGIMELKDDAPALVSGITQLKDGSLTLCEGLKQFNEKGVEKLVDAVNGDLKGLITRVKATVDVSKNYKSFSGISDDVDGQVKFIYRTDSIKTK